MFGSRLFAARALWVMVALCATAGLMAHGKAILRAPEGSSGRGEAEIGGDNEIRVRGDRLPENTPISVWIENADGELAEAFVTETDSEGSFDVRARGMGLPFGAELNSEFAGRAVEVIGLVSPDDGDDNPDDNGGGGDDNPDNPDDNGGGGGGADDNPDNPDDNGGGGGGADDNPDNPDDNGGGGGGADDPMGAGAGVGGGGAEPVATLLLEGNFPSEPDEDEQGVGRAPLTPPVDSPFPGASGRVKTKAERGRHALEVKVRDLADDSVYTVCVTNADGVVEEIGSITTNGGGNGALKVDTKDGGALPFGAGSVAELRGNTVQVKDADGVVVLAGTIPATGERVEDAEIEVEFDLSRPEEAPEPTIEGDIKFESEPQKDEVRVRLKSATAGSTYMARITAPADPDAEPGSMPEREQIALLEADGEGRAEFEVEGRPVLPLGASSIRDLAGSLVEILRIDAGEEGDVLVLVLSGVVPEVNAPVPDDLPPPVQEFEIDVPLVQPETPVEPRGHGKVELEEEDDEHEIEVEIEDLTPDAAYTVTISLGEASEALFDGAANSVGDIRKKTVVLGSEPLPLGVASLAELDGAQISVTNADGALVLVGTVAIPDGGGAGVALGVSFAMVGEYDAPFLRGDSNRDYRIDIGDPISLLGFLFRGGQTPPCRDAADSNDDGRIDISDPIFNLLFLFSGGVNPPLPGGSIAGFDPTADGLFCEDR